MATEALFKKIYLINILCFFSVVVGMKKMTDWLTSFIKIAISQLTGANLKKELLWPLPGMYMNTSEYSKSFYFILLKRTTSWQIAVFVNINIDFVT